MSRNSIPSAENFHLWSVSGGICSFDGCNKRLIMQTNGKLNNIGERAHIIGNKPKSARHEFADEYAKKYGFSKDNLENEKNLMLMCHEHHKLIDDFHTRDDYPPDLLFKMKKRHEKQVKSLGEKKKSIAIVHKRYHGPMISLPEKDGSPTVLLEAVEDQEEFSTFTNDGWLLAKKQTKQLYDRLIEKVRLNEVDIVEVYPLSPIPLLVYLGKLLSDTVPYFIFQYDRDQQIWYAEKPEGIKLPNLGLSFKHKEDGHNSLVVTISISGSIDYTDVNEVIKEPFDQLNINVENPSVDLVKYTEQVKEIQKLFKYKTENLITNKGYRKIHLFYAGPAGLAVEIGRSINESMWPKIYLYNFKIRNEPRYQFAFCI